MQGITSCVVYCGSQRGKVPAYQAAAEECGRLLATAGIEVVYGGGRVGLMGFLADTALQAGGKVYGVIPRFMLEKELGHKGCTLEVVDDMQTRKRRMLERSQACIILPGGIGTLEEGFEALDWLCSDNETSKPVACLNVGGMYNPMVAMLHSAVHSGFATEDSLRRLIVAETVQEMLLRLTEACNATAQPCPSLPPSVKPATSVADSAEEVPATATAILMDEAGQGAPIAGRLAGLLAEEGSQVVLSARESSSPALLSVAGAAQQNGGKVVAVVEKAGNTDTLFTVVQVATATDGEHSRHALKRSLFERSGRIVAVPGGVAVWEHFLELLSGAQLQRHTRPVGLLNADGFYEPLLRLLQNTVEAGFTQAEILTYVVVANTPEELLRKLRNYSPTRVQKFYPASDVSKI